MKIFPQPKLIHLLIYLATGGQFIAGMIFCEYRRRYTADFVIIEISASMSFTYYAFSKSFQKAREITRNSR